MTLFLHYVHNHPCWRVRLPSLNVGRPASLFCAKSQFGDSAEGMFYPHLALHGLLVVLNGEVGPEYVHLYIYI